MEGAKFYLKRHTKSVDNVYKLDSDNNITDMNGNKLVDRFGL